MKLRVWEDARQLYTLTWKICKDLDFKLDRIVKNQLASVDSIHRNIAEGYCRKSIADYLRFVNYSLASLGESTSSIAVYQSAGHINEIHIEEWNDLAYKLENGLIKLTKSLQKKQQEGSWEESLLSNELKR